MSKPEILINKKDKVPLNLALIFITLTIGIILLGIYFYYSQKENILAQQKNELTAISDYKTRQIELWLEERIKHANSILQNKHRVNQLVSYLNNPGPSEQKENITEWFNYLSELFDYKNIILYDINYEQLISLQTNEETDDKEIDIIRKNKPVNEVKISELHQHDSASPIHLSIYIPIKYQENENTEQTAVLTFIIDVQTFIFPTLVEIPTRYYTMESLIVQKKENYILFLSELKFKRQTALKFKIPLTDKNIIAVQASEGKEGITYGNDYRNEEVLAHINVINGTSWFLITKIDMDEINSPILKQTFFIFLIVLSCIIIAGIIIILIWRNQKSLHYHSLYQKEVEGRAMAEHYAYLSRYANDIILLVNEELKIVQANDKALECYGYSKEEFLELYVQDLRIPELKEGIKNSVQHLKKKGNILFETEHKRKDGSSFPVEVSSRLIDIEGKIYYQNIIRDITERKIAEEKLRESEEKYRLIIEHSTVLFYSHTPDHVLTYMSPQTRKFFDCEPEEALINWTNFATDNPVNELGYYLTKKAIDTGKAQPPFELELKGMRGRIIWVEVNESPVVVNGKTTAIVGSLTDITARKNAEDRIFKLNRIYKVLSEINQAIVRIKDEKELFEHMCRILFEIGNFRMVWIAEHDKNNFTSKRLAVSGYDEGYTDIIISQSKSLLSTENPFHKEISENKCTVFNNLDDNLKLPWRKESVKRGYSSMCIIPLNLENGKHYALYLYSGEYDFFSKEEIELLTELAADISFALNSFEKEKLRVNAETELKNSKKQLEMLYKTSERFNRSLNPEDTYKVIIDFVSKFMDCEGLIVSEYNSEEQNICYKAAWIQGVWSNIGNIPPINLAPEGQGFLSRVIRSGKSLIINDYAEELKKSKTKFRADKEGIIYAFDIERKDETRSALFVPLKIEGKVIGVMHVISFRKNAYTDEQKKLLESISVHISSAINNASIYRLAREEINERKKTENELRHSEERFALTFKLSPVPTVLTRLSDGTFLDVNEEYLKLLGYEQDELIGRKTTEFNIWDDISRNSAVEKLKNEGIVRDLELKISNKKGEVRDTLSTLQILHIRGEECVMAMIVDVTEKKKSEEQLRKLSRAVNQSPASIIITDTKGAIEYVNSKFTEITGYDCEEVIGQNPRILKSGETPDEVYIELWRTISNGNEWHGELYNKRKNGKLYWEWASISPIFDSTGNITNFLAVKEDITAQKIIQEQILLQATLIQNIHDAVIYVDVNFKIKSWNEGAHSIYGWSVNEAIDKVISELIKTEYYETNLDNIIASIRDTGAWKGEVVQITKDKRKINVLSSASSVKDNRGSVVGVVMVNKDITEIKQHEVKIRNSLKEKELLLKEIHHRVKNNLQIISSLLKMQAGYIKDPVALDYFKISSQRVKSMALIHEQLYRSADLSRIDFQNYVKKLTAHLYQTYGISSNTVKMNINIKNIKLSIDTAIPCGLLVNELISNSLKHAFPGKTGGRIDIEMTHEDNLYMLSVRDSGIGFPADVDFKNTETLGMQLINTLTEQIDGKIELKREKGTEFKINFKIGKYKERI